MKASTRDLFPGFYDAERTASSVRYIASVDRTLIEDGTYFVVEANGELVACGGWSRRNKLYTGSRGWDTNWSRCRTASPSTPWKWKSQLAEGRRPRGAGPHVRPEPEHA